MSNTKHENSINLPRRIIKCFYNIILNTPICITTSYYGYVIGPMKMEEVGAECTHSMMQYSLMYGI